MTEICSGSLPMQSSRRFSLSRLLGRRSARRTASVGAASTSASAPKMFEKLEGRTLLSVSLDPEGFTVVTPSGDSNVIYVSSNGSDSNSGSSPGAAVRTIGRGKSLLRNGFPDQLLLERGSVFNESFGNWNRSG